MQEKLWLKLLYKSHYDTVAPSAVFEKASKSCQVNLPHGVQLDGLYPLICEMLQAAEQKIANSQGELCQLSGNPQPTLGVPQAWGSCIQLQAKKSWF